MPPWGSVVNPTSPRSPFLRTPLLDMLHNKLKSLTEPPHSPEIYWIATTMAQIVLSMEDKFLCKPFRFLYQKRLSIVNLF